LAHRQEIDEPFEAEQAGSSAMPYKRNPMRCERMCGLARFLGGLAVSAAETAAVQWLERTLDDSVNRRHTLPQAFLCADGVLRLALNVAGGMVVNPDVIRRYVEQVFPYVATENVLMAATAAGGDRQDLHERIRVHSHAVTAQLKAEGGRNDLLDRLRGDPAFSKVNFPKVLDPKHFVGRAPEQVDEFIAAEAAPLRRRYQHLLKPTPPDVSV
jgi:adenylosuccinate lyase